MKTFVIIITLILISFNLFSQKIIYIMHNNGKMDTFICKDFYVDRLTFSKPNIKIHYEDSTNIIYNLSDIAYIANKENDTFILVKDKSLYKKVDGRMDGISFFERKDDIYIPYFGNWTFEKRYFRTREEDVIKFSKKNAISFLNRQEVNIPEKKSLGELKNKILSLN